MIIPRRARCAVALLASSLALGCGGPSNAAPRGGTVTAVVRSEDPLAALRPPGSAPYVQRLVQAPRDPNGYAEAAVFHVDTAVPAMTLLFGVMHTALTGGSNRRDVADAMAEALRDHVTFERLDATHHRAHVSLAPGAMPVVMREDGVNLAPVAHLFEQRLTVCLATFTGTWSLADAVDAFRCYASTFDVMRSTPDGSTELDGWLHQLYASGHLDAFLHAVFGGAFEDAFQAYTNEHTDELDAMRAWIREHPFVPSEPVLADDLLAVF